MAAVSVVTDMHLHPNDRSKSPVLFFHLSPLLVGHREHVWVHQPPDVGRVGSGDGDRVTHATQTG